MRKLYPLLLLMACVFSTSSLFSQISKGKNFWFGFMANYNTNSSPSGYRVYVTSEIPTSGVMSSPLQGWSQAFSVTPGVSTLVTIPVNIAENTDMNAVGPKAIHVVTDECVSVFAHNYQPYTSDAEVIFPVNSVGSDYYVAAWYETVYNLGNPELLVAATESNTQLSITLPVSTQGYTAGVPFTISLDTGEVFQLQSTNGDLTGTRITSVNNKNFAVFGGHVCANIVCTYCDHICEQIYPLNTWGTEYITVPLQTRPYDVFRIIASANGTLYSINGGTAVALNAGQFMEVQLSAVSSIVANKPISVIQYSIGASCNTNGSTDGDPFMISLSPTSQSINKVTFNAFQSSQALTYYLNVVAKTADLSTVSLDGTNIGASFSTVPQNPTYSYAQLIITPGDHTVTSNQGTQASVYAYGSYESFGYSAGVRVAIPFLSVYDTTRAYCPTDTVSIGLNSADTTRLIYTEWDLGDGSPHLYDTLHFQHVYNNYGKYPVTLIYEMLGACEKDTVIIDTIKILGPEPTIGGPFSFCSPQSLSLHATFKIHPDSLYWTVGGVTTATADTNFVLNLYADKDTVVYFRMTSAICDGYDTARIYVAHDTAGFSFTNACEGSPVNFVNTSQTVPGLVYQWFWDYGDGTTSVAFQQGHQYATGGTYTVKLRLTSPAGCVDSIIQTVTVTGQPIAAFVANPVCKSNVFTPVNNSSISNGTMTQTWTFGDGSGPVVSANPSHTYAQSGGYMVTLTASSGSCIAVDSMPVNIIIGAQIDFEGVSVCLGQSSLFNDASVNTSGSAALSYNWDFGDGATDTGTVVTHTFNAPGTYNITYVLVYGANCADTLIKPYALNTSPLAGFIVSDLCNTGTVAPADTSTVTSGNITYSWNFGDNTAPVNGQGPQHTYALSGTYDIEMIAVSDSGCADTVTHQVNVIRGTNIAFNAPPVCDGGTVTFTDQTTNPYNTIITGYEWDLGDGSSAATQNTTHTYATFGSYSVELKVYYSATCADSLVQQVTVNENPVAAFTVADVCNDSVVSPVNNSTLGSGALNSTWSFGDGTAPVTGTNTTHTYAASNNYTIQLIAAGAAGCADTATGPVTVVIGTHIAFSAPAVCEGASTTFTDQTTNPYNTTINGCAWNFGDGNSAATQNATHMYAAAGTYNVVLTLNYNNNCSDSLTQVVTVNANPVAAFTVSDVCNDSTVTPVNTSTYSGALTGTWNFGDGTAAVSGNNPTHSYALSNSYNIQLIAATAAGCADTAINPVTVVKGTLISFSAPPACLGAPSIFTDLTANPYNTAINSYQWSFGDGNSATAQNTSNTYANAGTYNVQLLLTYNNNCADSVVQQVVVNANPVAAFTATSPCNGSAVQFTDASTPAGSISSYGWNFGDNNFGTAQNPAHVYPSAGSYNARLVVATASGCTDSITQPVTVLPVGTAGFTVPPVCYPAGSQFSNSTDTVTYPVNTFAWTMGDGIGSGNAVSPTYAYGSAGSYNVTMIAVFANGCADTSTAVAQVNNIPVAAAQVNNVLCNGGNDGSIVMAPTGNAVPFSYAWSNSPANSNIDGQLIAGSYSVIYTDANTCTASAAFIVSEPAPLAIDTTTIAITCYNYSNGQITANASGGTAGYIYSWSNGAAGSTAYNLAWGTYYVTATDGNGCTISTSATLANPPKFTVQLPLADTVKLGQAITLSPGYINGTAVSWAWSPDNTLSCALCQITDATPYYNTLFSVVAVTDLGCVDSAAIFIWVDSEHKIFVPNAFTPNGDGINDYFEIYGNKEAWKQFNVEVFDRTGEKVFESDDMNFKWDGTYKGALLNPAVFVYMVKLVYMDNQTEKLKKGSVTLLR